MLDVHRCVSKPRVAYIGEVSHKATGGPQRQAMGRVFWTASNKQNVMQSLSPGIVQILFEILQILCAFFSMSGVPPSRSGILFWSIKPGKLNLCQGCLSAYNVANILMHLDCLVALIVKELSQFGLCYE